MRKIVGVILLSCICMSCNDKDLVTQKIVDSCDCAYSAPAWAWSNGVATVGDVMYVLGGGDDVYPQFNFRAEVTGELSYYYKINDDYLGYINVRSNGYVSLSDDEEGPVEWTQVKAGHVDVGSLVIVEGRECSIKEIMIVGRMEENNIADDGNKPNWDF